MESIVDEEGGLFYAGEDEVSVLTNRNTMTFLVKMKLIKVILLDFNFDILQRYNSFPSCLYIRRTNLPVVYSVYSGKMSAKTFWFIV